MDIIHAYSSVRWKEIYTIEGLWNADMHAKNNVEPE